jgi:multidrug efflux system membrane fusion protein
VSKTYRGSIGYYVEALGTVTPLATVNVYSQVNGTVTAVHYVEGQMVHRGDPLLDIDPRPYEAQLKEALATLQHDQASLRQAQQDLRPNLFGILAGHSSHNRGLHRVAADPGV